MKDVNGRTIELKDTIATPYSYEHPAQIAKAISDAILGTVIEMFSENGKGYVHIGDGIAHPTDEIVTLSGLEWVTCDDCGFSWPFDVRMNEEEECPVCEALLRFHGEDDGTEEIRAQLNLDAAASCYG